MANHEDGHGPETCYRGVCRSESDVECPFFPKNQPPRQVSEDFVNKLKADAHEHQYTIPVEWSAENDEYHGQMFMPYLTGLSVTKLRCVCGSEIDR